MNKKSNKPRMPRNAAELADIRDGRKTRAATIPCARRKASRTACRGKVTA